MMVCLICHRASRGGSVYCGGCGRTFGKFCANGHANSPSPHVSYCTSCGSADMTEPTRYLSLPWAGPALAGLFALLLWRWGVAHLALIGGLLGRAALALLLDTTPCGVVRGACRMLAWLAWLWILGWALAPTPGGGGGAGKWLRGLPAAAAGTALAAARPLLRLLGRLLLRAVWPAARQKGGRRGGPKGPNDEGA